MAIDVELLAMLIIPYNAGHGRHVVEENAQVVRQFHQVGEDPKALFLDSVPNLMDDAIELRKHHYDLDKVENHKTCLNLSILPSLFLTCLSISQNVAERKVHFKPDRMSPIESSEHSLFTGESKADRTRNFDVMQSEDWQSLLRRVRISS